MLELGIMKTVKCILHYNMLNCKYKSQICKHSFKIFASLLEYLIKILRFAEKKSGAASSTAGKSLPVKTANVGGSSDADSEISGLSGDGIGEAMPVSGMPLNNFSA